MFDSTIEVFDRYCDKMEKDNLSSYNSDLAIEVRKRIEQLNYLFNMIKEKDDKHMKLVWDTGSVPLDLRDFVEKAGDSDTTVMAEKRYEMKMLMFEIEMYTESFYYLAGRMRTILRNHSEPLPKLKSFECEGARNVRNKLLEHAEGKDSRVFVQNFGIDGELGPILKAGRPEGQEDVFPDAGLYVNAKEIKSSLEQLLNKSLTEHE